MDEDLASVLESIPQTLAWSSRPTNIPRSKRQSFRPPANGDATPRGPGAGNSTTIEPLSIKKKTSIKLAKIAGTSVATGQVLSEVENILHLAQTTKEDVESGHRAVKRLKVEIEKQGISAAHMDDEPTSTPSSPTKSSRTPQRVPPPLVGPFC
ncbi:hypothetical protein MPER_05434 [Moniliophthora perniciosa FA553]|nr:hypothetical protein MPER_05434 [Moniliophthora perniciosa FA553]